MKTKKKLTSRAGFTLVELVVAIAILAILAGIGGAAYSGYIKRAQEAKDVAKLADVLTAAQSAAAIDNKGAISEIKVEDDAAITITAAGGKVDTDATSTFANLYNGGTEEVKIDLESDTYNTKGAKWTQAKGWEAAA